MGLFSPVNPDSVILWRTAFGVAALGGAVVLVAVRGPAPSVLGLAAYLLAIVLYLVVALVAVFPRVVTGIGLHVAPIRVEAVLLTVLVFLGVNVAWLLLFDETPGRAGPDQGRPGATWWMSRRRCTGPAFCAVGLSRVAALPRTRDAGSAAESLHADVRPALGGLDLPIQHGAVERRERVRIRTIDHEAWEACDSHGGHRTRDYGRATSGFGRVADGPGHEVISHRTPRPVAGQQS